jgi:hypothetical protein
LPNSTSSGNFEDNLFVEGMSMVQFTVLRTEEVSAELTSDARDIVMAHHKHADQTDSKSSCQGSRQR